MPLLGLAIVLSIVVAAPLAASETPTSVEQVRRELQQFALDMHAANVSRDRAALDRLLADEFVWIHAFGYVDDKATVIAEAMEDPAPPPLRVSQFSPPERFYVSGNLVVTVNPDARTAAGSVAWGTSVYVHRDGRWQLLQRQGTELNPTAATISLTPRDLEAYVGRYTSPAGQRELQLRHDGLYFVSDRFPPRRMIAIGPDLFTTKVGGEIRFERNESDRIMRVTFTGRGQSRTYDRVN